jgi:hypothetical protein
MTEPDTTEVSSTAQSGMDASAFASRRTLTTRRFLGNTFHERLAALPGYEATAAGSELLSWEQFTAALNGNSR